MIEIKNLIKSYDREVLKNISYSFEVGKIYVIKGVSGCGKSTLLNIIGGVETDYDGECLYEGRDIKEMKRREFKEYRQSCAYIFQNSLLISGITVLENLMYIRDDEEKIRYYAAKMNVEKLLEKYPEQLSGGERQRISIIRALLWDAKIILADEPTAALDIQNTEEIVEIFDMLRSEKCVVIVATHADSFDDVANEVLHLDYGVIGDVEKNKNQRTADNSKDIECKDGVKHKNSLKVLWDIIFVRNKKKLKISTILPMTLVIMAVLVCFGVQHNYSEESMKYYKRNYPMDMIYAEEISTEQLLKVYDNIEVYKLYTIETDEYTCYPMYDKEESVLAYGNLIKYGNFPDSDTEVIINNKLADKLTDSGDLESCIGMTLDIKDATYTISGVLADLEKDRDVDVDVYNGDWYYRTADASNIVYMSYDILCEYGEEKDIGDYMVKIPGLYDIAGMKDEVDPMVGHEFPWEWKMQMAQDTVGTVNNIIMVAFGVVAVIAAIFIRNDIELDLFYRKKELGYLQIFGVKKSTIWLQIISEKISKNLIAYGCAVVLFHVALVLLKLITGINGFVAPYYILMLFGIVIIFSFFCIILPIRKFMKKSVLQLITE